jgi:hypothetical protein
MALVLAIHRCERGSGLGRLRKVVALLIYTQHCFKELFLIQPTLYRVSILAQGLHQQCIAFKRDLQRLVRSYRPRASGHAQVYLRMALRD